MSIPIDTVTDKCDASSPERQANINRLRVEASDFSISSRSVSSLIEVEVIKVINSSLFFV